MRHSPPSPKPCKATEEGLPLAPFSQATSPSQTTQRRHFRQLNGVTSDDTLQYEDGPLAPGHPDGCLQAGVKCCFIQWLHTSRTLEQYKDCLYRVWSSLLVPSTTLMMVEEWPASHVIIQLSFWAALAYCRCNGAVGMVLQPPHCCCNYSVTTAACYAMIAAMQCDLCSIVPLSHRCLCMCLSNDGVAALVAAAATQ
jgi:hypothetical protein